MSQIVIAGESSGSITLAAPDVGTDITLSLPSSSGTLATTADIPASKSLKLREARSINVTYTAATDGFFNANVQNGGVIYGGFTMLIDGNTVVWSRTPSTGANGYVTGTFPVRAGETYNATLTGGGASAIALWFIPFS